MSFITNRFNERDLGRKTSETSEGEQRASSGQVLIMFAFFITAMIGVLGLAVDLGYAYSQKRSVQNAADLAAVAGARQVARFQKDGSTFESISAGPDVRAIVSDNHMENTTTVLEACYYIDLGGFPQSAEGDPAGCDGTIPPNATGVYVSASETHSTFFMRAIPGAPVYVTTSAEATATVERLDLAGMDSPFILCGTVTKHRVNHPDGSVTTEMWVPLPLAGDDDLFGELPNDNLPNTSHNGGVLLYTTGAVNPAAIGETFQLAGVSATATEDHDVAKCGAKGSFKTWHGLANKQANLGKRIVVSDEKATWWNPMIGLASTNASTVTNKVSGIDGCAELASSPYDCVMMIPIATEYDNSVKRLKVTKIMAFDVWQNGTRDDDPAGYGSNVFWGTLIDDYLVFGASVPSGVDQAPWCRDCGSVVVVRLAS